MKFEVEAVAAIRDWKWHGKNRGDPIFHVCDKMCSPREAACNQSQLFPFIHDKIFVWIQKKESQGCHTAGNLSTIGFLLYDSALCLDPHMESSLTDFVYRAL